MLLPIPRLQDYDVSPLTGFLPEEQPLEKLPEYFASWDAIAGNLPALLLTRRLRAAVDRMPKLDAAKLQTEAEWRRACSVLGFIAHGYVWSRPEPSKTLPNQLTEPWIMTCDHFGLQPVASYAGLCLWNFKTVIPCDPAEWDLESLATLVTYTGAMDESWFYLVSTALERQGAPCIVQGLEAIQCVRDKDIEGVVRHLQAMAEGIDSLGSLLGRMNEMCDPHSFYFRLRPFLAGWKNMADAGLPDGVWYGDEKEPRQYAGGSNAQSSLIQALDVLLNVEHNPLGERKPPTMQSEASKKDLKAQEPPKPNFLRQMRQYMPTKHREFLEDLERVAEIRDFVIKHGTEHPELTTAYDACLAMLRSFRSRHIQIVTRYIIMPARQAENKTIRDGIANNKGTTGTGGTQLLPFLKQARDEVGDAAAGSWGRRLMSVVPHNPTKDVAGHW